MLKLCHQHLLPVLKGAEVVNVSGGADPFIGALDSFKRRRAGLMPAPLAVGDPADAVLDVVLALGLRLDPRSACRRMVVGMDGVEPALSQAFRQAQAREHAPLRTAPGAVASRFGAEKRVAGC